LKALLDLKRGLRIVHEFRSNACHPSSIIIASLYYIPAACWAGTKAAADAKRAKRARIVFIMVKLLYASQTGESGKLPVPVRLKLPTVGFFSKLLATQFVSDLPVQDGN
jgi:hypothetical protein